MFSFSLFSLFVTETYALGSRFSVLLGDFIFDFLLLYLNQQKNDFDIKFTKKKKILKS